jgi:hypothetical protein
MTSGRIVSFVHLTAFVVLTLLLSGCDTTVNYEGSAACAAETHTTRVFFGSTHRNSGSLSLRRRDGGFGSASARGVHRALQVRAASACAAARRA